MELRLTSVRGAYNWLVIAALAFALGVVLAVVLLWLGWIPPLR